MKVNPSTINFKMDNRSEIEQKLGIPLGENRGNRKSVVEAFKRKGLSRLNPTSVSRLKAGMISGERIDWRLDASRVLEEDNANLKNPFYEQITQVGLQERIFNTASQRAHVLKSNYFVEDIAKAMRQDPQVVRRCIRAMRVDMVLTQADSPDAALLRQFSDIAEGYIDANRRIPPSLRSAATAALDRSWDHSTIENFYRNIYAVSGGRAIGTWTPYEMEVIGLFYRQRVTEDNHLTPFDRLVLDSYTKGLPASQIVGEVTGSTGIELDEGVVEQHRNVLTFGRPTYKPTSR